MSDQDNSSLDKPQPAAAPPAAPQQPFIPAQGAAPGPAGESTFGSAPVPPSGTETIGSAPAPPSGPETFGAAPETPETPAEPRRKKSGLAKLLGVLGAIVLAVLIAGGAYLLRDQWDGTNPKHAKVGDCIGNAPDVAEGEEKQADNAKLVDCASADARYKVEGRLEEKTNAEARSPDICTAYPTADRSYYAIPEDGKGVVLCLSSTSTPNPVISPNPSPGK